ncbi:unnamed protein product [Dicrocoelium dendriticum]|nr:unnamed protein product [Dicrocoelium dendriticum]
MPFVRPTGVIPRIRYFRPVRAIDESIVNKEILAGLDLKPLKSVTLSFNPFVGDVSSIRKLCGLLSIPRWRISNPYLIIKTNVLSTFCPPTVELHYGNENVVVIKTEHLSLRELIEILMTQSFLNSSDQ